MRSSGGAITPDAVDVMLGDNHFAQLVELSVAGRWANDGDKKRLKDHFGDRVAC